MSIFEKEETSLEPGELSCEFIYVKKELLFESINTFLEDFLPFPRFLPFFPIFFLQSLFFSNFPDFSG